MKKMYLVFLFLIIPYLYLIAQESGKFILKYPDYTVALKDNIGDLKDLDFIPFVLASNISKKNSDYFGLVYSSNNTTVLNIQDVANNISIIKVTLDELFGKESTEWNIIKNESSSSESKLVNAYQINTGNYNFKLYISIEKKVDLNLPKGNSILFDVSAESSSNLDLKVQFTSEVVGKTNITENTFSIETSDTLIAFRPQLIFKVFPESEIKIEESENLLSINSSTSILPVNNKLSLFTIEFCGTSVGFQEYVSRQVSNVINYWKTQVGKPDFVAVTFVDNAIASPGDTVKYSIYYHNIGSGVGIDIIVNNLIPNGAAYIENSAEGESSLINITRKPILGNKEIASNIAWNYSEPIYPGEERRVSFKVRIL
ncbi:hypothetical protein ACFLS9_06175 [Bacteroidota bacterium]